MRINTFEKIRTRKAGDELAKKLNQTFYKIEKLVCV